MPLAMHRERFKEAVKTTFGRPKPRGGLGAAAGVAGGATKSPKARMKAAVQRRLGRSY